MDSAQQSCTRRRGVRAIRPSTHPSRWLEPHTPSNTRRRRRCWKNGRWSPTRLFPAGAQCLRALSLPTLRRAAVGREGRGGGMRDAVRLFGEASRWSTTRHAAVRWSWRKRPQPRQAPGTRRLPVATSGGERLAKAPLPAWPAHSPSSNNIAPVRACCSAFPLTFSFIMCPNHPSTGRASGDPHPPLRRGLRRPLVCEPEELDGAASRAQKQRGRFGHALSC